MALLSQVISLILEVELVLLNQADPEIGCFEVLASSFHVSISEASVALQLQ